MKAFIVFLLSCASVHGEDDDIRVVTTAKTNAETASITTKDFYTRDGQTNLVRHTKTKAGFVQIRIHRFYHAGSLVGDYVTMPDSSGFTTEAGTHYSVSLESNASRYPKSVVIGTKDGVILDAFSYTNGVFSPVESSLLTKANATGSQVRGAMEELSNEGSNKQ
jgi:hypothetical protein